MKSRPIKRSDALKRLSREHHFGLLFTWKIKQGLKLNVETSRLLDYLNYFWEGHLKGHFFSEEVLLFNKIDADVCKQAKLDHQMIANQIEQLNSTKQDDRNAYQVLIDRLNDHIRYEERVVFPHLEDSLSASLAELMTALEGGHTEDFKDVYHDQFWVLTR